MIKANELRLGNWIEHNQYPNDTVIIRIEDGKHIDEAIRLNANPIPLTEKWLIKFGFFVENFDYAIPISECKVVWLTLIPQDEECSAYSVCVTQTDEDEEDQTAFLSDISYVHQLQNLYFALTGEELEVSNDN